ncbi:MAG: hypothetical protein WC881_02310 [Elusimicrobiota bacterium]
MVLALAALAAAARVWALGRRARRLRAELDRARVELEGMRAAPRDWECQIERFDVSWYPVLNILPAAHEIARVTVGLPYCRTCALPLSQVSGGGAWRCPGCDFKSTAALEDVSVLDTVAQQALRVFRVKHPEYPAPARN